MADTPPVLLRAIYPSAGVEKAYATRIRRDILDKMAREVLRMLHRLYPAAAVVFDAKRPDSPTVTLNLALEKWARAWTDRVTAMSDEMARKFATRNFTTTQTQIQSAFKAEGFTVSFKPTEASTAAYQAVAAEQVNLIKSVPQQFLKDVQSQVWESVMAGGDMATLSKGIQEKYNVSWRRAALIARDQNNKAKAVIENVRRKELGITKAIWQHSSAGKVPRPTHVAMNGKVYNLSSGMYDTAEKQWILPGELINCRCTSRAVLKGFE